MKCMNLVRQTVPQILSLLYAKTEKFKRKTSFSQANDFILKKGPNQMYINFLLEKGANEKKIKNKIKKEKKKKSRHKNIT